MTKINLDFKSYLKPVSRFLSSIFDNTDDTVIFGGFIRDILINNLNSQHIEYYDLDIVGTSCLPFKNNKVFKNRFNGNTIFIYNTRIDFWELRNTFSILNNKRNITLDELPTTTVFTCNSIVYNLNTCKLYEDGFFKSLESKTIEFNDISYLYNFPELQAVRAYYLAKKLNFKLSSGILDFIFSTLIKSDFPSISKKIRNSKYDNFNLIWNIYKYLFSSKKINSLYCERYIRNKFFNCC